MDYHRSKWCRFTRIVRIFNTYGPRMLFDDGRVVSNFIVQALRERAANYLRRRAVRRVRFVLLSDLGPMAFDFDDEYRWLHRACESRKSPSEITVA